MKITIFTSNSLRHLNLINNISKISKECNVVIEAKTVLPGIRQDFFTKSKLMKKYFLNVEKAEKKYFFNNTHTRNFLKTKIIKQGDLNYLNKSDLSFALKSNIYIIFGSSFITNKWLINFLIKKRAINIHMGLSPFYRGSSCNFWALKDKNPEYVGSTIHYLSKGLDSGNIISHCLPDYKEKNIFNYTMSSVKSAHDCLSGLIKSKKLFRLRSQKQNKNYEIRYSKNNEFNDNSLKKFSKLLSLDLGGIRKKIPKNLLVNPYYFNKFK